MKKQNQTNQEQLVEYLSNKYDSAVLTKDQMAKELGVHKSTVDKFIAKGYGLPPYRKLGNAKCSKMIFNIIDVAKFLDDTVKFDL